MHFWQVLLSNKNCIQGIKAESRLGSVMGITPEFNHPFLEFKPQLMGVFSRHRWPYILFTSVKDYGEIKEHNKLFVCVTLDSIYLKFLSFPKLNPPQISTQVVPVLEHSCLTMHLCLQMAKSALVGGSVGGEG